MTEVKEILKNIENKSNTIVAKLELLHMAEDDGESLKKELKNIKEKLENDEITKFSYATMLEVNKKKADDNKNNKKQTWDEIAEIVNGISDHLEKLKDLYNQKTEPEKVPEIVAEEKPKEEDKKEEKVESKESNDTPTLEESK